MHEHSHVFGYDGHRGFTDALTELIETLVRERVSLDAYDSEWDRARAQVMHERSRTPADASATPDRLEAMGANELRSILRRLPESTIRRLVNGDES